VDDKVYDSVSENELGMNTDVCNAEIVVKSDDNLSSVELEFAELHRIEIFIQGVECSVKCLEDSGAQIGIIRSDVLSNVNVKHVGTVKLRGIFGSPVDADLIQLHVKTIDNCDTP